MQAVCLVGYNKTLEYLQVAEVILTMVKEIHIKQSYKSHDHVKVMSRSKKVFIRLRSFKTSRLSFGEMNQFLHIEN